METNLSSAQLLEKLFTQDVDTASFPTHFSIVIRLRSAMNDKQAPHRKLVNLLSSEPVISARLLQVANSVQSHGKEPVFDLSTAIMRLGQSATRRIVLGVAMSQLTKTKEMLIFANISRVLWLHSIETAMSAFVIADELTTFPPDEAFFAGLVVNMGGFYLLFKASQYPLLHRHPDEVNTALARYHPSLTKKVLQHLDLPSQIIDAVDLTDFEPRDLVTSPKSMNDIIKAACVMASLNHMWGEKYTVSTLLADLYTNLTPRINENLDTMRSEFRQ